MSAQALDHKMTFWKNWVEYRVLVTLSCIAFGILDSGAQALDQGGWESGRHCVSDLFQKLPPLIGRFVPFAAVAAANCINIPCMRSRSVTAVDTCVSVRHLCVRETPVSQ